MSDNSYGIKENTRYKNDQGDRVVLVTKVGGSPLMVDYVQNGQSLQMRAWAFKKEFGKMVNPPPRKKGGRPKKPASKRVQSVAYTLYPDEVEMIRQMATLDGGVSQAVRASVIERYNRLKAEGKVPNE